MTFFSSYLPYRTLSSERRCLAEVSMEMQSHLFLSFYLKSCHFFLLRGKLRFLQIFISVAWLLPMNVFKLEGFLFFQNFLKDVFGRKFLFPWGRNGDAKVVFFLAGSFSRNREVFESDGLVRRFFFLFFQYSDVDEEIRCFRSRSWYLKIYEEQSSCPFFDV
jgi:hypothetical protein